MSYERHGSFRRTYLAILGGAAAIAVVGTVFAGLLSTESIAAPTVAPSNVTEPRITGTTRVGQVLRSTRGTWTGTEPIDYEYRWFRCDGRGAADASDCRRITNASNASYSLRQADAGFRIRSQVVARNADGQDTATSNPTNIVTAAKPVNTTEPSITGTARVGSTLEANRGQWAGDTPITYSFVWLRCNDKGDNCSEIQGANDTSYEVRDGDSGQDHPRSRHRAKRPWLDVGHLEPDRCRRIEPAAAALERRDSGERSEGGRRSSRRRVRAVLAEPGDEQDRADHRACPDHGSRRASGQRCERVHARHSPRRLGPDGPDGR